MDGTVSLMLSQVLLSWRKLFGEECHDASCRKLLLVDVKPMTNEMMKLVPICLNVAQVKEFSQGIISKVLSKTLSTTRIS